MRIGTSQSMRIPSRTSLVKSVMDEVPPDPRRRRAPPPTPTAATRTGVIDSGSKDEVERRRLSVGGVLHPHHQVAIEDGIPSVPRIAGKVELSRERWPVRGLQLHVEM